MEKKGALSEVAMVFLKLGCTAFGGPAVHIAMMEAEIVNKRKWITPEHFLDLIGATNLILVRILLKRPCIVGTNVLDGRSRSCRNLFLIPAVIITGILAWAYQKYGTLPEVQPFIYGIKPAIIAVIVALMISLGKKALKSLELDVIGVIATILVFAGFQRGGLVRSWLIKDRYTNDKILRIGDQF